MYNNQQLPGLNDRPYELRLRYSLMNDEQVGDALVEAINQSNITIEKRESSLYDWINLDALNDLFKFHNHNLRVSSQAWNRVVVITQEDIRIYVSKSSPIETE